MLIIRRREGESILIGGDIEVQITEIGSSRVKLAIVAPREVSVMRKEVELTRRQNVAAASGAGQEHWAVLLAALRQNTTGSDPL